jgi:hypothetical protein
VCAPWRRASLERRSIRRPGAFYLGVFLTTQGVLVYQVTSARVLSALTWYYLAFASISLAMLGMTAADRPGED